MAGIGPVPKRTEERLRVNKPEGVQVSKAQAQKGKPYPTPKEWHIGVKRVYDAAKKSGQAKYFEQSDWAFFYLTCDRFSNMLKGDSGIKAIESAQLWQQMNGFLLTEAERRRARIELVDKLDENENETRTEAQAIADLRLIAGGAQ